MEQFEYAAADHVLQQAHASVLVRSMGVGMVSDELLLTGGAVEFHALCH